MPRLLLLLSQAFMVWMMYDAYRRRASGHWYWIIFLPFGEWFYFFKVKIHDPDMRWLKETLHREKPASLESLRYHHEVTPSETNRLRLAQALHDAREYEEASGLFEELLQFDAGHLEARYGLARCQVAIGRRQEAVSSFETLIAAEPSFAEYEPWLDLARVLWQLDRRDDSIARLSELVDTSPRLTHALALAQFQKDAHQADAARTTLREALHHFDHAPKFFKRRNRIPAFQAKRMLRGLG